MQYWSFPFGFIHPVNLLCIYLTLLSALTLSFGFWPGLSFFPSQANWFDGDTFLLPEWLRVRMMSHCWLGSNNWNRVCMCIFLLPVLVKLTLLQCTVGVVRTPKPILNWLTIPNSQCRNFGAYNHITPQIPHFLQYQNRESLLPLVASFPPPRSFIGSI